MEENKCYTEMECDFVYENQSPQLHKLKISYIINEPTAPVKEFGGIFKSTAVDSKTGIEYYNFLETDKCIENNKINSSNVTRMIEKKRISVKLNYKFLHIMNDETKKFVINKILLRKISW